MASPLKPSLALHYVLHDDSRPNAAEVDTWTRNTTVYTSGSTKPGRTEYPCPLLKFQNRRHHWQRRAVCLLVSHLPRNKTVTGGHDTSTGATSRLPVVASFCQTAPVVGGAGAEPSPTVDLAELGSTQLSNETSAPNPITLPELADMKSRRARIVMVTAYDAPAAHFAERAGIDMILVGDSAGKRVLGYKTTLPVTMDELMVLTAAVCRSARRALVVADMPFGSYQVSDSEAVANAIRFVKKAGAAAVKLEGAGPTLSRVHAIVNADIPVIGHIGFTPQSATALGLMATQTPTAAKARRLYTDALDLQEAGCFAMILDMVPDRVASRISEALRIPTIGVGSGPGCDGQLLVWHDLLGMNDGAAPTFVKRYADVSTEIMRGLTGFASDVRSAGYPSAEHSYPISDAEFDGFEKKLSSRTHES